jgi:hypothetical protein
LHNLEDWLKKVSENPAPAYHRELRRAGKERDWWSINGL